VLRSVEIHAEVTGSAQGNLLHNLRWLRRFELTLDCYQCELTGRTTVFESGRTTAICTAGHEDDQHRTSARIETLECGAKAERQVLRAVLESWWTPFKTDGGDSKAQPLGPETPIRLALAYFCRRDHRSANFLVQTGMDMPTTLECQYCGIVMATMSEPPSIRLLTSPATRARQMVVPVVEPVQPY
jgi:hypothetical protein